MMPPVLERLVRTDAPAAVLVIRLAVGLVFLSEGIQKWIRPEDVGAARFARIGIPRPSCWRLSWVGSRSPVAQCRCSAC